MKTLIPLGLSVVGGENFYVIKGTPQVLNSLVIMLFGCDLVFFFFPSFFFSVLGEAVFSKTDSFGN